MASFSVVIPTAHRPDKLEMMLESLVTGDHLPDQIVIVDQSTDDLTRKVVASYHSKGANLLWIPDQGSGTSRAKNIGWRACNTDVVCFTDDDATVDAGWLKAMVEMARAYPDFGVVGGAVLIPNLQENLPLRFPVTGLGLMPWLDLPGDSDIFPVPSVPVGVNFMVLRETLRRLGGFNEDLGPNYRRRIPLYGEEGDFCRRVEDSGLRIYYNRKAIVWHPLYPGRNSAVFFRRRASLEFFTSACRLRGERGTYALIRTLPRTLFNLFRVACRFWAFPFHEIYFLLRELQAIFFALFLTPRSLISRRKFSKVRR